MPLDRVKWNNAEREQHLLSKCTVHIYDKIYVHITIGLHISHDTFTYLTAAYSA